MARERPTLALYGTDGPILGAILDVLADIHDLLDVKLPPSRLDGSGGGPVRKSEPAPAGPPAKAVPVSEPAPDTAEDPDRTAVEEPSPNGEPLPQPPSRAGRGSGLDAWQTWANLAEVDFPSDASRNDIIAACVEAGAIPAE